MYGSQSSTIYSNIINYNILKSIEVDYRISSVRLKHGALS